MIPLLAILAESTALVGGTVHSLAPGEEPRVASVLVVDGRIAAVEESLEIPPGCERVDAGGLHLVPGLIDGLAFHDPAHDILYTAHGVVLVRDHGNDLGVIFDQRDPEVRDQRAGPGLSICGAPLDGVPPSTTHAIILRTAEETDARLPVLLNEGIDFVSIQPGLPREAWLRVIELATERRLQVWGPPPSECELEEVLASGQDGILYLDALLPGGLEWEGTEPSAFEESIQRVADSGVAIAPLLMGNARWLADPAPEVELLPFLGPMYDSLWTLERELRRRELDPQERVRAEGVLAVQRELVRRLHEAGVPLVPGSGAPHPWLFPGLGLHRELEQWQEAGIPPAELLHLATAGAARALGLAEERGTLEVGKVADILLLREDPTRDVAALRRPAMVVLRGRLLGEDDLEGLLRLLEDEQTRARGEAAAPLEIPEPDLPEGSVLVRGYSEAESAAGRISGERWAIVRRLDRRIAFCGRAVNAQRAEVDVEQVIGGEGRLQTFRVAIRHGGHELVVRGMLTAGQMRVERRYDGAHVDTRAAQQTISAVDVGSVTAQMLLAHTRSEGELFVLRFHEGLELEVAQWKLELSPDGRHLLSTPGGPKFSSFREDGALELMLQRQGNAFVRTSSRNIDTLGGPGLPLPPEKLRRMRGEDPEEGAGAAGEESGGR